MHNMVVFLAGAVAIRYYSNIILSGKGLQRRKPFQNESGSLFETFRVGTTFPQKPRKVWDALTPDDRPDGFQDIRQVLLRYPPDAADEPFLRH